jgi:hypothetical protein
LIGGWVNAAAQRMRHGVFPFATLLALAKSKREHHPAAI